jgi:two-component system OmpR family response regulator
VSRPDDRPDGAKVAVDDSSAARVLVVDDEQPIAELVATALRYEGFDVSMSFNGLDALDQVVQFRPDLVVLDVMLPDVDGFEVQARLRRDGFHVPVLFLSARDAVADKVRGLTLGADDYMTKPFSVEELVARVRTVLRRAGGTSSEPGLLRLRFGDLELDEETHEVWRANDPVHLTPTEFKLLRYLMLNPRRVLSKTQILDHVWQYDFDGNANVVENYISYLRKKVDASGPALIHTVRGVGYCLRQPAPDRAES